MHLMLLIAALISALFIVSCDSNSHKPDIYTVTFDTDGGSAVEAQKVEVGCYAKIPHTPSKDGYDFRGWYKEDELFDFSSTPITADITLKAKWTDTAIYYTVTFDSDGGSSVDSQKVRSGSYAEVPDSPRKDGFDFRGWLKDGEMFDFSSTPITGNITLKAMWTDSTKYYDIVFYSDDSVYLSLKYKEGDKVAKPKDPEKEGYYFDYWTFNGYEYNFNAFVTSNLDLIAKFVESCTIVFETDGGSDVEAEIVEKGTKAVKPEDPTRDNDIFDGWYLNDAKFDFDNTPINDNITLKAHWTKAYKVSFNSEGGSDVDYQIVKAGEKATAPKAPIKEGYSFKYWTKDGSSSTFEFDTETINSDIKLNAIWQEVSEKFTVTFDSKGGSDVASQQVPIWGKVERPKNNPTKAGFYFVCWTYKGSVFDFANVLIHESITLEALWSSARYYTITFDTDGGSHVAPDNVREGYTATKPADPTKQGYQFVCWNNEDGSEFSFTTPIVSDMILTAKWQLVPRYVTFEVNGEIYLVETVNDGGTAYRPATPTHKTDNHKLFMYWSLDNKSEFDFDKTPITKNTTLYAVFRDYKVGDIGKAGGYIFYDVDEDNESGNKDGLISSECGWRYLEAAKEDYFEPTHWGDGSGDYYGTKYDIGKGFENTEILIKQGKNDYMAYKIWKKEFYGYNDWFVPSRDELDMMYQNLHKRGLGGFRNDQYWSSSEYFNDGEHSYYYACFEDFATGKEDGHLRDAYDYMRIARRF